MQRKSVRAPGQIVACAWCGTTFTLAATGRIPKWCSRSCRQRAWEQRRAVESGLAAVDVVVRIVEVEKPVLVPQRVAVPTIPKGGGWTGALAELVVQLDRGLVYDRHLPDLVRAINEVLVAMERRPSRRRSPGRETGEAWPTPPTCR